MKIKTVFTALIISLGILLAGCRTSPVMNVESAPIKVSVKNASDVQKAIVRAGVSLGWQMKKEKPGHIIGTLYLRSHMAKVDIFYNTKTYSIKYKDSSDLNFDSDALTIHSNYNGWIQNLDRAIQSQLTGI